MAVEISLRKIPHFNYSHQNLTWFSQRICVVNYFSALAVVG